jgi:hypothetical protein
MSSPLSQEQQLEVFRNATNSLLREQLEPEEYRETLFALPADAGQDAALEVLHSLQMQNAASKTAAECCVDYLIECHQWNPAQYIEQSDATGVTPRLARWLSKLINGGRRGAWQRESLQEWEIDSFAELETDEMKFGEAFSTGVLQDLHSLSHKEPDVAKARQVLLDTFTNRQSLIQQGKNPGSHSPFITRVDLAKAIKKVLASQQPTPTPPRGQKRPQPSSPRVTELGRDDTEEPADPPRRLNKRQQKEHKRAREVEACDTCYPEAQRRLAEYFRTAPAEGYLESEAVDEMYRDIRFDGVSTFRMLEPSSVTHYEFASCPSEGDVPPTPTFVGESSWITQQQARDRTSCSAARDPG